jgi:arylsulfatase A-like enzyme
VVSSAQPNIVVIVVDDQPALDGRLMSYMPNTMANIVSKGIALTDFHSESPFCCPARAGFFTGQHSHNHGVVLNQASLFKCTMSLATQLRGVGYETDLVGKYFNAYRKIASRGVPAGWDHFAAFGEPAYYNYTLYVDGFARPYSTTVGEYSTDVLSGIAVNDIKHADPNKPLFLWTAPYAEHASLAVAPRYVGAPQCKNVPPWKPPNWNESDVSDKPGYVQANPLITKGPSGQNMRKNCWVGLAVDDMVGAIVDALRETGRLENTILVYSGDNGMNEGEHRLSGKAAPYATNIPFYIAWPAGLGTTPRTISEPLQNIDFAPTICALAGCTIGPFPNGQLKPDGVDFSGLLRGNTTYLPRDAVLDEMPAQQGKDPTDPPVWYAVRTTAASPLARQGCALASVAGCRWHYIEYATGEHELYDVSDGPYWQWNPSMPGDPAELNNLLAPGSPWANDPANAHIHATLQQRLAQLKGEPGYSNP